MARKLTSPVGIRTGTVSSVLAPSTIALGDGSGHCFVFGKPPITRGHLRAGMIQNVQHRGFVYGNNVIGSGPDAWWLEHTDAAQRLTAKVVATASARRKYRAARGGGECATLGCPRRGGVSPRSVARGVRGRGAPRPLTTNHRRRSMTALKESITQYMQVCQPWSGSVHALAIEQVDRIAIPHLTSKGNRNRE